ncbi:sigma-54 interaction domain-containing protein [Anaeromyxobacter paludicola]|uniref:Sigma-54-dependent Fis family transcriptional regulator n=1 Tax=Anaeromyxobacter paludicola TaxID=2918171 RepID=A0ABN6N437_9BACT|nr:sigma-54 dependent transcriptional regulator [Anaeromyxobacter paludicola]BDG07962.1 sigma-54-dependent Fis family transcriptional regulator [Anaeromyxobacter paludicola]
MAASQLAQHARTQLVHAPDSPMVELFRACARIAASEATVLITGETGTGKEVIARLIHEGSARAAKPLIPVNCGAIPEALLESELFGHVKGAFTGAIGNRRGRVAAADGGTLFLDEIGELPLSLQVKLLRVLQERSYEPVGSAESVPANFRLVAATNRDLAAEVEAGHFRRDLYYRLLVCPVEVLPLRERRGDIPHLFAHFWSARGETRPVEPAVLQLLQGHDWPGNVRELENLVERLAVCSEGSSIRVADLPHHLRPAGAVAVPARREPVALEPAEVNEELRRVFCEREEPAAAALGGAPNLEDGPVDLPAMLRRIEDGYIEAALARTGGNKKAAADLLGLQRTTLVEKLRRRNRPV